MNSRVKLFSLDWTNGLGASSHEGHQLISPPEQYYHINLTQGIYILIHNQVKKESVKQAKPLQRDKTTKLSDQMKSLSMTTMQNTYTEHFQTHFLKGLLRCFSL